MEHPTDSKPSALQRLSAARAQERANTQSAADAAILTRSHSEPIAPYNQAASLADAQSKNDKKNDLLKMFKEECDSFLKRAQNECTAEKGRPHAVQLGNPAIEANLKQKQREREKAIVALAQKLQSITDPKERAQIKHEITFLTIDFYEIGLATTLNALIRTSIE